MAEALQRCAHCGHENPGSARFCNACGRGLPGATPLPPDLPRAPLAYTPDHLTREILRTRSSLEGERKLVTVLFADIVGSLAVSRRLGPEEWHHTLDRFFQILSSGIHRFEGSINQYTGDGVMALFGAPLGHEDHAQRACHAALHVRAALHRYSEELQRRLGIDFAVRIGINTGEVIVGKIGDDLRMDYTAQGDCVGLAARLQQIALPGTICLSEAVAELVDGFFELGDRGAVPIAGFSEPVAVRVLEAEGPLATRLDASALRGFSRFVGRADELMTLGSALGRAERGEGVVVGIEGEAGLGKSRLCHEFIEHCRSRGLQVYEAHCPSHGRAVGRLLLRQLLRTFFALDPDDPAARVRSAVAADPAFREPEAAPSLPLVLELLDAADPESAPAQPQGADPLAPIAQLLRAILRTRSADGPLVLLVDDLHWIDAESDAQLARLVEATSQARALLLVNFRPEYTAPWMQLPHFYRVGLGPLDLGESGALLSDLLGSRAAATPVAELVREHAAGNPFFLEEVVRSLAQTGVLEGHAGDYRTAREAEELALPASIQALLAARIDRLSDAPKQVLQTAAVLGLRFSPELLQAAVGLGETELGAALAALQSAGFVVRDSIYPKADCSFRHPLAQEVAYWSLLGEQRARIHAAAAVAIEGLDRRLGEQASLLAHHWELAGDLREAGLWRRRAAFQVTNLQPRRPRPRRGARRPEL